MRLITWNCQGAFHRKQRAICLLRPDVLIVPECRKIVSVPLDLDLPPVSSFHWVGKESGKGLAAFAFGDYQLSLHPQYDARHRYIVPLEITGPTSLLLFAVWTFRHTESHSYLHALFEAFEAYREIAENRQVLWVGDFNSSFAFDKPWKRYKFRDYVPMMEKCGYRSLYHEQAGVDHGEEPDKTFFLYRHEQRSHHIDYIFANAAFQRGHYRVDVGKYEEWRSHSDHMPLICDFNPPR